MARFLGDRQRQRGPQSTDHVGLPQHLLKQLEETQHGNRSMLDNSVVIYEPPMGHPNQHSHKRVPCLLAGHGGGRIPGGVHLRAKRGTPLSNVMLSLLHTLGFDDLQCFGDSEGTFSWE
jgi:hypothetical protein